MTLSGNATRSQVSTLRTRWGGLDASKRALFGVLLLLLVGLLVKAFFGALTSAAIFAHPFQLDESEGMIVAETMLLDKGTAIYAVPGPDLFISAP